MKKVPQRIRPALLRHRQRLLELVNVIGCGVGRKEVGARSTEQPALIVFVSRKLPLKMLSLADRIPSTLEGIPTDVIELGEIRLLNERTSRVRPAPPGVSIGHYRITA